MKEELWFHFDEVPPSGTAVSVRARYLLEALVRRLSNRYAIVVTTTQREASDIPGVRMVVVGAKQRDPNRSFVLRLFDEVVVGAHVAIELVRNEKRPRLVVMSSPGFITALFVTTYLRLAKIEYGWDVRDLYPDVFSSAGLMSNSSLSYKALNSIVRSVYQNAVLITAATETLTKGITAKSKETIFNGYPSTISDYSRQKFDVTTVIFHGNMGSYQDMEGFLALAKSVTQRRPEVRFLAVGSGTKACCVADSSFVEYLGQMSHEETLEIVSRCHVGVSPRTDDPISAGAFPVKIWEYIGLHLPVLSSPLSEAGIFLEKTGLGLQVCDVSSPEAVDKLIHLIDSQKNGFSPLETSEFTRENQAARFADAISSALSKG